MVMCRLRRGTKEIHVFRLIGLCVYKSFIILGSTINIKEGGEGVLV